MGIPIEALALDTREYTNKYHVMKHLYEINK